LVSETKKWKKDLNVAIVVKKKRKREKVYCDVIFFLILGVVVFAFLLQCVFISHRFFAHSEKQNDSFPITF